MMEFIIGSDAQVCLKAWERAKAPTPGDRSGLDPTRVVNLKTGKNREKIHFSLENWRNACRILSALYISAVPYIKTTKRNIFAKI